MIRKLILTITFGVVLTGLVLFGNYWINTQPIWLVDHRVDGKFLTDVPARNKQIIDFLEENGKRIAPNYGDVDCTEFVINVIDNFDTLTKAEKSQIRIITKENLRDLITTGSPIIKGVQTALVQGDKGIEIKWPEDVRPGDFVQFWNKYQSREYGHCGVVLKIDPNKSLTLYSSHPLTNGYGKQKYLWPDKVYFVRLK